MSYVVCLCIGLLLTLNCSTTEMSDAKSLINPSTISLKIGQESVLQFTGEVPATVTIKFNEIKEGRCALVNCPSCYGGYAYAYLSVTVNDVKEDISLSRISCVTTENATFKNPLVSSQVVNRVRIGMADLTEYTGDNKREDYTVKLLLSTQ